MYLPDFLIYSLSLYSIIGAISGEQTLIDLNRDFGISIVKTSDAKVALISDKDGYSLLVSTGHKERWPGITIKNPEKYHDLSGFQYVAMDVKNVGTGNITVNWRIDNPNADGIKNCITNSISVAPNEKKTLKAKLPRKLPDWLAPKMFGMRGFPGGLSKDSAIDLNNIVQFTIFVNEPKTDDAFEISNIRAGGKYTQPEWVSMSESQFFPMIDEYGQFIHKDWLGKTKSAEDLEKHKQDEQADIKANPEPADWDKYGGWKGGPKLRASGYFRAEKFNGKWWLVDPDGYLFWSHGIDCVGDGNGVTPITDREYWFRDLPDKNSPFGKFYGEGSWAPHNYYEGKTYKTVTIG
ncbi:MAG: hypothetical protein AAB116_03835, partial [Candidatus Poribacteria bacterium]